MGEMPSQREQVPLMQTEAVSLNNTIIADEPMTTFRIRLPKHDVEGLRRLARAESQRLQRDVGWCVLLRDAIKKMATEQTPIR